MFSFIVLCVVGLMVQSRGFVIEKGSSFGSNGPVESNFIESCGNFAEMVKCPGQCGPDTCDVRLEQQSQPVDDDCIIVCTQPYTCVCDKNSGRHPVTKECIPLKDCAAAIAAIPPVPVQTSESQLNDPFAGLSKDTPHTL